MDAGHTVVDVKNACPCGYIVYSVFVVPRVRNNQRCDGVYVVTGWNVVHDLKNVNLYVNDVSQN
jgi:hypothetical protein